MTKDTNTMEVMIEIPKGGKNKYEYDEERGIFKLDRALYSAVHYPSDYGFVMGTLGLDGDSLDALVLVQNSTFPGCVIDARPIGVFNMIDEKGKDAKILCVAVSDPLYNHYKDIKEVPQHLLDEIEHFFSIYKDLEMKKIKVRGWGDSKKAYEVIKRDRKRFNKTPSK